MKKLLILSLMIGALGIVVPSAEAKTTAAVTTSQQIDVRIGQPRRYRRTRTVMTTRVRWVGGTRYRETIRTTYFANGRTRTVIVNRVRLGGRRIYRNY